MRITHRELLCTLLCVLAIAAFLHAERNDVAIDPDGGIYTVSKEHSEIIIRRLSGEVWKIQSRLNTTENAGEPAITWVNGGLLAAWSEKAEDGGKLVFARVLAGRETEVFRVPLSFAPRALAMEEINGFRAGVLAAGPQARWLEVDVRSRAVVRAEDVPIRGTANSPSILPGTTPWISWEERDGDRLGIAAAHIEAKEVISVGRFRVRGYGSVAMPVLADDGGPAVIWQGIRGHKAALYARNLTDKGFGSIKLLPSPQGVGGIIRPRRAAGSSRVISAATWNNVRWSAVRYDLGGEERRPRVSLRVDEEKNMRSPVVAMGEEDTWLWSDTDGEIVKGTNLSERVFERPAVAPAVDGEIRYLAFGDSITNGKLWDPISGTTTDPSDGYLVPLAELHEQILGPVTIDRRAVSGENTVDGLVEMQAFLESPGVYDRVLLLEGTNDYHLDPNGSTANEITVPNLVEMVALIRAHGAIPIVGTMLPRDGHPTAGKAIELRAREVTAALIPAMQRLGVRIARFHELFPLDDEHLADEDGRRVHPTEKGYALMAEIWMEALLTFEGDVDRNGVVDYRDAQLLSAALGTRVGNFLFNPDSDVNSDGIINIFDLSFVYGRFGTDFYAEGESGVQ